MVNATVTEERANELLQDLDVVVRASEEWADDFDKTTLEGASPELLASLLVRASRVKNLVDGVHEKMKNRVQFLVGMNRIKEIEIVYEGWPHRGEMKERPFFRMVTGLGADLEQRAAAIAGGFAHEGEDMFFQVSKFTKDNVAMLPPDWKPRGVVIKPEKPEEPAS